VNPETTYNGSLESYSPYLLLQKVSKKPHTFAIHSNMPKNTKGHFLAIEVTLSKLPESKSCAKIGGLMENNSCFENFNCRIL
jgi:hypothetical protein